MLNRLPRQMPPLKAMLADIGCPSVKDIARALQVHETTVRKWLREDHAPHPVMLAVFWLTRWGVSAIDCEAHNAAVMSAGMARCRLEQIEKLETKILKLAQIGDFGSANDPDPSVVPLETVKNPPPEPPKPTSETELQPGYFRVDKTGLNRVSMRANAGLAAFEKMRATRHEDTIQKKTK
jgi:hypothetical protein